MYKSLRYYHIFTSVNTLTASLTQLEQVCHPGNTKGLKEAFLLRFLQRGKYFLQQIVSFSIIRCFELTFFHVHNKKNCILQRSRIHIRGGAIKAIWKFSFLKGLIIKPLSTNFFCCFCLFQNVDCNSAD